MNRRGLLQALLGAGMASLLPIGPARSGWRRGTPSARTIRIQDSPLAGFQYHHGERLWPHLRPGDRLALVREPANTHDPRAVRVEWKGRKLGYVPRRENIALSQMLDDGQRLSASIAQLRPGPSPWDRIRFTVRLEAR